METMTLQEAADRLGTHYMTVYRYVRLGRLPARKVGGTWQVEVSDVEALRRGDEQAVRPRPSADWSTRLESRILAGDEAGAWGVIEAALASANTPSQIYTDLIIPALTSIGSKWHKGDVSVAQEHLATAVVMRLIGRLGPHFARKGRPKGVVVVTTPAGERHAIPSLIVADLLRGAGFQVLDLGTDVPPESLGQILERVDGLTAVCVSSTRVGADPDVRATTSSIRTSAPGVPIFIGGASVADIDHAIALGGDGWASDGPGAVEIVMGTLT